MPFRSLGEAVTIYVIGLLGLCGTCDLFCEVSRGVRDG
jgi:hypothetical protein